MMSCEEYAQSDFYLDHPSFARGGRDNSVRANLFLAEAGDVMALQHDADEQ
jgi:hypothetical protein